MNAMNLDPLRRFKEPDLAPQMRIEMLRLYRLMLYGRWMVVLGVWLTVGMFSLWGLRSSIALALDYFTWAAVRYAIVYHRLPALGLAFCLGLTAAVLTWQSRNLLFGLPQREKQHLHQTVLRIHHQGQTHPLWRWVRCEKELL
jgi:hypothetical protein